MDTNEINRIKNSTPFFIIHPEDGSYIEIKTIDDVTRRFFYYTKISSIQGAVCTNG